MRIALPPSLTLAHAARVRGELLEGLARGEPLALDLAATEEVDVAGLQLLVAAAKSLQAREQALRFEGPMELLRSATAAAGLTLPTATAEGQESSHG